MGYLIVKRAVARWRVPGHVPDGRDSRQDYGDWCSTVQEWGNGALACGPAFRPPTTCQDLPLMAPSYHLKPVWKSASPWGLERRAPLGAGPAGKQPSQYPGEKGQASSGLSHRTPVRGAGGTGAAVSNSQCRPRREVMWWPYRPRNEQIRGGRGGGGSRVWWG